MAWNLRPVLVGFLRPWGHFPDIMLMSEFAELLESMGSFRKEEIPRPKAE